MAITALIGAVLFGGIGFWLYGRGHRWPMFLCFIAVGLFLAGTPIGGVLHQVSNGIVSAGVNVVSSVAG